jgi:small-conductance mechanosensitive channel
VIEGIKSLLGSHPRVVQETHRVRFAAFGESALRLEVWCWIATRDYVEYTGIVEELNFAIAEIVERAGTSLALPGRTIHLAQGRSLDADGAHGARPRGTRGQAPGEPSPPDRSGGPGRSEPDPR